MSPREGGFRVLAALALAVQGVAAYPEGHPQVQSLLLRLFERIQAEAGRTRSLTLGFFAGHIVVDEQPFLGLNAALSRLNRLVRDRGIEKVIVRQEVTFGEIRRFVGFLASGAGTPDSLKWEAITCGRIETLPGDAARQAGSEPPSAGPDLLAGARGVLRDVLAALTSDGGRQARVGEGKEIVSSIMTGLRTDGGLIERLLRLQTHDDYTATHSLNVCVLVVALAAHIGLSERRIREIGLAALLHDIGKEAVRGGILNKPGRLDAAEFDHMKCHTVEGARILRRLDCGSDLPMIVAYEHHLRYDRSGYPARRSASPAHAASLMTQLADVYDALRSHRPYRAGLPMEKTMSIMGEGRGSEFDPALFDAFAEMVRTG